MIRTFASLAVLGAALAPTAALAHPADAVGFVPALLHPFTGLDHLVAMLAVGYLAARSEPAEGRRIATAFGLALLAGFAAGRLGAAVPLQEGMLALSLVVFGSLVFAGRGLPALIAPVMVALFGAVHGAAHGAELSVTGLSGTLAGFALACTALGVCGAGLGLTARRLSEAAVRTAVAGASVTTGLVLLAG